MMTLFEIADVIGKFAMSLVRQYPWKRSHERARAYMVQWMGSKKKSVAKYASPDSFINLSYVFANNMTIDSAKIQNPRISLNIKRLHYLEHQKELSDPNLTIKWTQDHTTHVVSTLASIENRRFSFWFSRHLRLGFIFPGFLGVLVYPRRAVRFVRLG